jgi:hypothetical protein
MSDRIAKPTRGKYDDVIEWLKNFESKLKEWIQTNSAQGMFYCMMGYPEIEKSVRTATLEARSGNLRDDMMLAQYWQYITGAWLAVVGEMDGGARQTSEVGRQHYDNVHAALLWFEKNNEPEHKILTRG